MRKSRLEEVKISILQITLFSNCPSGVRGNWGTVIIEDPDHCDFSLLSVFSLSGAGNKSEKLNRFVKKIGRNEKEKYFMI